MNFTQYIEKTELVVAEVAREIGFPDDKKLAARLLRAVLHALRSRLTIPESFQLMAQLPMLLKAIYVEGWKYREKPKRLKSIADFVREVIHEDTVGHHDITTAKDGENVVRAVLKVLRRHVSDGEVRDILQTMPPELRPLWGEVQPV